MPPSCVGPMSAYLLPETFSWYCRNYCEGRPNAGENTKAFRCSRCHSTKYCSKECAKIDWPSHKIACKITTAGEARLETEALSKPLKRTTEANISAWANLAWSRICWAAASALHLERDGEISDSHALRLRIRVFTDIAGKRRTQFEPGENIECTEAWIEPFDPDQCGDADGTGGLRMEKESLKLVQEDVRDTFYLKLSVEDWSGTGPSRKGKLISSKDIAEVAVRVRLGNSHGYVGERPFYTPMPPPLDAKWSEHLLQDLATTPEGCHEGMYPAFFTFREKGEWTIWAARLLARNEIDLWPAAELERDLARLVLDREAAAVASSPPAPKLKAPQVDSRFGLNGFSVFAGEDGIYYDATLNQTNIGENANKFYLIQVMIFNVRMMSQTMKAFGYDDVKLPLGKLSADTMNKGYVSLRAIAQLLADDTGSQADFAQLTNRYYSYVPHAYGMTRLPLIDTHAALKREIDLMEALGELKITAELMKVDKDAFKVCRGKEEEAFKANGFDSLPGGQRKLLWHGSRASNYGGILSQGLRIAPPEAPMSGYLSAGEGLLMLVEVQLGPPPFYQPPQPWGDANAESASKQAGMLSTWGVGRCQPI
ncbi:hypothetical protein RQP46_011047 [Phenoliferia psychrophenolica]